MFASSLKSKDFLDPTTYLSQLKGADEKTFKNFLKPKNEVCKVEKVNPRFAEWLAINHPQLIEATDLAKYITAHPRLLKKLLLSYPFPVLKGLLRTNLGASILTLFPPSEAMGKNIAKCPEVATVIQNKEDLDALDKLNRKAKQNPTMADALVSHHPEILKMKLMLTSPTDPITQILIEKAIEFKLFKEMKLTFLKALIKSNWPMAARLLQEARIVKQLEGRWSMVQALPYEWLRDRYGFNRPEKKLMSLNDLYYLDLATVRTPVPSKSHTDFDFTMKKSLSEEEKIKQYIAKNFLTTRDYFFEMMYGKSGYYTTGKIAFEKETKHKTEEAHFRTSASNINVRKTFAALFAEQLFQFREQMILKGALKDDALFNVLECGAGDGDLCAAIFDVILEKIHKKIPGWQAFYDCLQYHILEKSPALLERQKRTTARYKTKITYTQGDAMQLEKTTLGKGSMAAVISNELLDMFPPDRIVFDKKGTCYNIMMVPILSEAAFRSYFYEYYESKEKGLGEKRLAALKIKSTQHKNHLEWARSKRAFDPDEHTIVLDKKDFLELHALYSSDKRFDVIGDVRLEPKVFNFIDTCIELSYFPKLHQFLKRASPELTATLKTDEEKLICTGVEDFMKGASYLLQEEGAVLSVDYGGAGEDLSQNLRTFNGKIGYDITRTPGRIDMTYDVDFGSLQGAGEQYGLHTTHYKKQADLLTGELRARFIKEGLLDVKDFEAYTKESTSHYKVCIQEKTKLPEKKATDLPLTDQDAFLNYRNQFTLFLQPTAAPTLITNELNRISGSEWKLADQGNVAFSQISDSDRLEKVRQHFVQLGIYTKTDFRYGKIMIDVPWLEALRKAPSVEALRHCKSK